MLPGIFPNEEEGKLMASSMNMGEVFQKANQLQSKFNKKFGINFEFSMMSMFSPPSSGLKLCCVAKEFQPHADKIPFFTFVGPCIAEKVRTNAEITNGPFVQIFNSFGPINPNHTRSNDKDSSSSKLIFVSLGTMFNNNQACFEKIIEAFNKFDEEEESTRSQTKLKDLKIIFSLGKSLHGTFENKVKNENYKENENILLLPFAPQIEILKRASLFVTHAGMNSASEIVKYAVPVVAIPQSADQPLVAKRMCDDLKFGIRLDDAFTVELFRTSVHKILRDLSYAQSVLAFSKEVEKSNGSKIAANLILDFIR